MTASALLCDHCQLPIPQQELIRDQHNGRQLNFCCHGCQGAFKIIAGAGLEKFYRQRSWDEPGTAEGAFESEFSPELLESLAQPVGDDYEISFLVEGIRCASCVWLNEKILFALDGVLEARINYGTHRARVRFDRAKIDPLTIFSRVTQLGYRPRPLTVAALQDQGMRERRSLLIRFGTAVFLSMQLMGYSLALYAGYFQGIAPEARQLIQYFAAAVTTPVVFYAGWPFLSGGWRSLRNRAPNMDLLIAMGVLTAYGFSLVMMLTGGEVYFDSAAMIVTLILLGRLLEAAARRQASAGIDRLLQLTPDRATRLLPGDRQEVVESSSLQPGDLILVAAGERFAADGALAEGETEIDESVVTGEPLPVHRSPGERITSGSLNLSTAVKVRLSKAPADSFVARIARLVEEAQARRAPVQALADRVSAWFVPGVLLLALATLLYWLSLGVPTSTAILNSISVLVVACPCALGLATPTAVMVATGRAARSGILFRGGDILEQTARLTTLAFDKTGTLTEGRPIVSSIVPHGTSELELLQLAAMIESGTRHPIAAGILEAARQRQIATSPQSGIKTFPGAGLQMETESGTLRAGNRAFITAAGVTIDYRDHTALTEVHLALGEQYLGVILLNDRLRSDARQSLESLRREGYQTSLLTGDHSAAGKHLAEQLRLDEVLSGQTPEQKADWIREQQSRGEVVLMVGDGINDAPALSVADVGCAMAGGTDIALETSDIVLTRPDLGKLAEAITLARNAMLVIRENLFWAFTYNLVAIPLAASGKLAPVYAAAAMAASSICVVGNSLRLARHRVRH